MLKILDLKNNNYEFEFNGIKIINCDNPTLLYKKWFIDTQINIDNKNIANDEIIYISELSKLSDFINLNKKSFLINEINNKLANNSLINISLINEIVKLINDELGFDLLTPSEGDNVKLIQLIFDICNDIYLNEHLLKIILSHMDEKKLIIFDNISWLKLDFLSKLINEHHFIILTNDFRRYMLNKKTLELVVNVKNNEEYIDFIDSDKLFSYIEAKINQTFNEQNFHDFIKDIDSFESLKIFSILKTI